MSPDDLLDILEDAPEPGTAALPPWRLLMVDDDAEVHASTRFALKGVQLLGRPLELISASSGQEALACLREDTDFAVLLLDVVMESQDSGLCLVRQIRDDLGLQELRIILRTGQPGYAPELEVFAQYDINDYRTKAELTRTRLLTSLCAALRAYQQIRALAASRLGLEQIVTATAELMQRHALSTFASGVLTQITGLFHLPLEGVVCVQRGAPFDSADSQGLFVVGAAGQLSEYFARPLAAIDATPVRQLIEHCMEARQHRFEAHSSCLYLHSGEHEAAVYLATPQPLSDLDLQLLQVFAMNLSLCFGNVRLIEQLEYTAFHDPLTGLLNRQGFLRHIDQRPQGSARYCLALLDLAHFADLNDGLGHDFGNQVLSLLAARLAGHFPQDVSLARLSADIFGFYGPEQLVTPGAIQRTLDEPLSLAGMQLPLQGSVGLSLRGSGEESALRLLKHANIALNQAKKAMHLQYQYFQAELEEDTRDRLRIIHQLQHAFRNHELRLWYQPQINLSNGRVVGYEALMRWPDDQGGFVQPPSTFIPLAEYSGLILPLGEWALEQVCQAIRQISARHPHAARRIAVNVSMPQLRQPRFSAHLAAILAQQAVNPADLELEITESFAMDEPESVRRLLGDLRRLGLRIAVDDFGTGYSSLSHLRQLPIDCLKIDRSFVAQIQRGSGGGFAETIVALAQKLGLSTIAEGVETPEQAGFLLGLGCQEAQGFLYARPMPLEELLLWLEQRGP